MAGTIFRTLGLVTMLTMAGFLSACASIVEGTDQTVTVTTQPPGASCNLERDGQTIAVVNPTPGSVNVEKSKNNIAVLCEKDGYEDSAGTLASDFQGMTFGNILFGGIIGVAIDASSGAMHEYPPSVTVMLPPHEFASRDDRDAFYDDAIARLERDADRAIKKIRDRCSDVGKESCDKKVAEIEDARDQQIAEYENRRLRAQIAGQS